MAVEDDIRGTGVLTNKAPELQTSEPAFDDGSLACLGINTDTRRKMFTCPAKSQTELVGKTFWVLDYFANIEGKDGQEKYIFLAKWNLTDPDSEAFKVWTGSTEIFFILDKLREMNKFPRKVTLRRRSRGGMYFE